MSNIHITKKDNYAIVKLQRGKANPISHGLVNEIRATFKALQEDESVSGVILTGQPGFFSAGLDVIELYQFDKDQIRSFWTDWKSMVVELAKFSKPFMTAITGQSPAGGCVLAICSDYRLMVEGVKYRIGLNEVAVGIELPGYIYYLYEFWIGSRKAYQNLMQAKLMTVQEAHECNLIDEVCSPDDLLPRAEAVMQKWLKNPINLLIGSKANMRASLYENIEKPELGEEERLDSWFHPENRRVMGELVAMLTRPKS